jgi:hypothetical protein
MANNSSTSSGIGCGTLVFLIFLTLKLAGIGQVAEWSWWWVSSPLWIPIVLVLCFAILAFLYVVFLKATK